MNGLMTLFIVTNGMWAKAMITVYLCGVSVVIASIIGIPLGILAAVNKRAGKIIGAVIDTLQTLPSFVYLIPVVMLFRIGDFTAMIAIVLYALAPAVRYAAHGIRSVSSELIEAGIVSGCTPTQILTQIRLPLALPNILLGINQTIMLALSMLVIIMCIGVSLDSITCMQQPILESSKVDLILRINMDLARRKKKFQWKGESH